MTGRIAVIGVFQRVISEGDCSAYEDLYEGFVVERSDVKMWDSCHVFCDRGKWRVGAMKGL